MPNYVTKISAKTYAIIVFYLIAISLRYYFVILNPNIFSHSLCLSEISAGVGPLVGGLFVIYILHRSTNLTLFGRSSRKSLLMIGIPVILFLIADVILKNFTFSSTRMIVIYLVYAFCEEYGWRGYLQSELQSTSKFLRIMIISILWFVWHLNFEISGHNLLFFLILVLGTWGIGQISIKTKSLIACACFHSIINIIGSTMIKIPDIVQLAIMILSVTLWFIIWYATPQKLDNKLR